MTNEQMDFLLDQIRANLNQPVESLELELLEIEGVERDVSTWAWRDSDTVLCLNQLKEYIVSLTL